MKVVLYTQKTVKKYDNDTLCKLSIRLTDGRDVMLKATSQISVNPNLWNFTTQKVKDKISRSPEYCKDINDSVATLEKYISTAYNELIKTVSKSDIKKDWLKETVKWYYDPRRLIQEKAAILAEQNGLAIAEEKRILVSCFREYIEQQRISEVRRNNQWVIYRALGRYELFIRLTDKKRKNFILYIDEVSPAILDEFRDYLAKEHKYRAQYPEIFDHVPEKRKPQPRGPNTIVEYLNRFKAFYNWLNDTVKYTDNKPFRNYKIGECLYGDPVYPDVAELQTLYGTDMADDSLLEQAKDAFVLQSCIGCRVGDYYEITYDNIYDNAVHYVPSKTDDRSLKTVTVPLNDMALKIIDKYYDEVRRSIMPFMYEQDYNELIKVAFKRAGLTRKVMVNDTLTNKPIVKELWETATSHMARRTLVGNLYEEVKDPNLISSISGHSENSRAFSRYRNINRKMTQDLVGILSKKSEMGENALAKLAQHIDAENLSEDTINSIIDLLTKDKNEENKAPAK